MEKTEEQIIVDTLRGWLATYKNGKLVKLEIKKPNKP